MKTKYTTFLLLLSCGNFLYAHPWTAGRPDGHAPLGVMGDHMHGKGEWMASYRYMSMDMDGLRNGTNSASIDALLGIGAGQYDMVPTKMTMDMHMFGAMHAVSDKLTIMGMVNYLENDMDMKMRMMGQTSSVKNSGLGDLKIAGLYDLKTWDHDRRLHLNLGLSLPTGSIDEKDSVGNMLGYPMQLGSGTWDLLPGITYLGQSGDYSYGAQLSGVLRIGDNNRNYSLGESIAATIWGARKLSDSLSLSARLRGLNRGNVDGQDADIEKLRTTIPIGKMMVMDSPSYDTNSRGREEAYVGLGANYYVRNGQLKGHRFALEWETPIKEDFDGVQMKVDSIWTLGWQYAW